MEGPRPLPSISDDRRATARQPAAALGILSKILFAAAGLNLLLLVLTGPYDVRFGPVHLTAAYLFKPLLYLNASFLIALALNRARSEAAPEKPGAPGLRFWVPAIGIVAAVYGISFGVNLEFPDWTHRHITSALGVSGFFTERQGDGFYRPLTFLSLWVDNRIFGNSLWGYHLQNVLIHLANGALVARLANRLCLGESVARWSGLLFLALPAGFEAVIWPGARFDLLAGMFTLIALERALAGRLVMSTAAYVLGVLSKESAYCFPLLLAALYLWRRPLALSLDPARTRRIIAAVALATAVLIAVRIAVYGNLGGYPDLATGKTVQFVINAKTFTSMATRLPAALYVVNSSAGVPVWLGGALIAYVGALAFALGGGAGLGARGLFLAFAVLGAAPTLNMIGWMNHSAQQARYVYLPAIWIIFAVSWSLRNARRGRVLTTALLASMMAGAFFNTLAYVRMSRAADAAAAGAVAACRNSPCCRALNLRDLPPDLYGAFYFRHQVRHEVETRAAGVTLGAADRPEPPGPCTVDLRWTKDRTWTR